MRSRKETNVKTLPGKWLGFAPKVTEAEARERFRARFSCEPQEVRHVPGLLLLGPLVADERGAECARTGSSSTRTAKL